MAGLISDIQGILMQVYEKEIVEQLENNNLLYKIIEKDSDTKNLQGYNINVPLHTGRNSGIGARAEAGTLPTASNQTHVQVTVPLKFLYGRVGLSGPAIELAKKNISAFVDSKTDEMDGIVVDVMRDFNRQMHSDGTGVIAQANGAGVGTATLILNNQVAGETPAQYLQGQFIDIKTTKTGGTLEVDNVQVLNVVSQSATAATVTLASTQTWTDDSYIFRAGNQGNEITGLLGAIDDGTTLATYFGINRTSAGNQYWKANLFANSGTPRNATEALFNQAFLASVKQGGKPTHAVTSYGVYNTLGNSLIQFKKFDIKGAPTSMKLPGGYTGFSINGIDVVADIDCAPGRLYVFNAKDFTLYQPFSPGFVDYMGSNMVQTPNQDFYTMTLRWYIQLFCRRPNVQSVEADLQ